MKSRRKKRNKSELESLQKRFLELRERKPSHRFLEDVKQLRVVKGKPVSQMFPEILDDWLYELNCGYEPDDFNAGACWMAWWSCPKGDDHVYAQVIASHVRAYRDESKEDGCPFCAGLLPSKTNNLQNLFPELVDEWDAKRNGRGADLIVALSCEQAWWICTKNKKHRWQTAIVNRTSSGSGCPHCLYEWTDLKDYKRGWKEFFWERNKGVDPHKLPTEAKVWWKCSKADDHVWRSSFYRTQGVRCPFCRGIRASSTNNLTMRKDLLSQFHPTKNKGVKPEQLNLNTHRRVWWQCNAAPDHEWQTMVVLRVQRDQGCPYCKNRKLAYSNSLAGLYPKVARDWHPTANKPLKPDKVLAATTRRVWWLGKCGHEWQQAIRSRTLSGHGCTVCWRQLRSKRMSSINKKR